MTVYPGQSFLTFQTSVCRTAHFSRLVDAISRLGICWIYRSQYFHPLTVRRPVAPPKDVPCSAMTTTLRYVFCSLLVRVLIAVQPASLALPHQMFQTVRPLHLLLPPCLGVPGL